MLTNIQKLNTKLCLMYVTSYIMILILPIVVFNTNIIKASAEECSENVVEVEINEQFNIDKQLNIDESINKIPNETLITDDTIDNNSIVNPADMAEIVENSVICTATEIADTYKPQSPLSDKDIELLARVIHAEAGNQDETGKRLVADTVLNRMDDKNDSMHDIVYAPGQFSTVPVLYTSGNTPTEDEYRIAFEESISRINYDVYYFRTGHYHNCGTPAFKEGAHYFSTL